MPAPRRLLQRECARRTFDGASAPPGEIGTTWSRLALPTSTGFPQIQQSQPSRSKIASRSIGARFALLSRSARRRLGARRASAGLGHSGSCRPASRYRAACARPRRASATMRVEGSARIRIQDLQKPIGSPWELENSRIDLLLQQRRRVFSASLQVWQKRDGGWSETSNRNVSTGCRRRHFRHCFFRRVTTLVCATPQASAFQAQLPAGDDQRFERKA